jgi:hypothetical protein
MCRDLMEFVASRNMPPLVVPRRVSLPHPENPVRPRHPRLSPYRLFRRIGGNTLLSQILRELLPPLPQRCLANVQPLTLLAHSFYDEMHMRVRLICVQRERVPVHQSEFVDCKFPDRLHQRMRSDTYVLVAMFLACARSRRSSRSSERNRTEIRPLDATGLGGSTADELMPPTAAMVDSTTRLSSAESDNPCDRLLERRRPGRSSSNPRFGGLLRLSLQSKEEHRSYRT